MNNVQSAAIYLRASPTGQVKAGLSIEAQKMSIMQAANELGYFVKAEYIDTERMRPSDQPTDLQRLVADCCSDRRSYETVIVHDFTQISRYHDEVEACRRMLKEVGVKLISAASLLDSQED